MSMLSHAHLFLSLCPFSFCQSLAFTPSCVIMSMRSYAREEATKKARTQERKSSGERAQREAKMKRGKESQGKTKNDEKQRRRRDSEKKETRLFQRTNE